jgi:hypothetical protein
MVRDKILKLIRDTAPKCSVQGGCEDAAEGGGHGAWTGAVPITSCQAAVNPYYI